MGRKGFTLIEAVMVMAIIAIISVSGAYLMLYLVQNSVFIPSKLNVDMVGEDLMDIMIEGDSKAKGLRFSTFIGWARPEGVEFRNSDGQRIRFRWDIDNEKIYRTIDIGAEEIVPYYADNISVVGIAGARPIFTYYDENEDPPASPLDTRRIKIEFKALSGSGNYRDWQGESIQSSSIAVRRFE